MLTLVTKQEKGIFALIVNKKEKIVNESRKYGTIQQTV